MGKPRRAPTLRHAGRGRPGVTRDRVGHRPGTTGAAADGRAGVGGLHTSEDVGERVGPRTRPSKGGPCWCELSKGPMMRVDVGTHVTRNSKGSGPLAEVRCVVGTISSARASDSRANLGRIAMSHISGRAGWWKPPSPVLVRASGEQSPGATRRAPGMARSALSGAVNRKAREGLEGASPEMTGTPSRTARVPIEVGSEGS